MSLSPATPFPAPLPGGLHGKCIAFVGGGNMAAALIGGLRDAGAEAGQIRVLEIQPAAREALQQQFSVSCSADAGTILPGADVVVLAVKPQQLAAVCRSLAPALRDSLVISIAAGVRTGDLGRWLGGHDRIVRAMPNTPALVRAGVTGLFARPGVEAAGRALAADLLAAVGTVVWVEAEAALDAVTAISGSGPAYVFHFLEGLIAAGESLGLDPATASQLALATVAGSAQLAHASPETPATLRVRVTSPGGTTAAALAQFTSGDLTGLIGRAAAAAAHRAQELGDALGKDQ